MGRKQIPVVIVAGFLGSGKTTLLNHLLSASGGTRIGVVVNDFGSVNIDAMQVAGQVDSMISLGNGCLCCLVDASGMDELLERLARPGLVDVIVIEASGLAEPRDLIRMVLASDNPGLCYGGLVEVVDGAEFESSRQRHPELDGHLRYADLVVLNKIDRIDAEQQALLRKTVTELSEGKPVLPTSHGRVDPALLFEQRPKRDEVARQLSFDDLDHDDHSGHAHAAYESVVFSSAKPLNPRRLMAFLDSRPTGLYRMKGFVHFGLPGHRQKHVLHTVGGFLRFERSRWERDEAHHTHLVLIGSGIDADAVRAGLADCVETDPAPSDKQAMLLIAPYLR
ncbi:GTP-binding protein [Allokutzneria sp. A3M-2-11 16]|uniref:CobW family GTP-binding protein n=1 Tax=Allokutzneria sp. A3M-2-11 16 TaxID=2962043 RepID=UPI0020B66EE4|nr:GTP-binding protein [Allokutzneria sp. A3M-2-11 16]MCP3803951.1 GTP-binding protein [Allokutzneria sp. A3M-2-11 16]